MWIKLHISLLAYLELNFCILSSISVFNSAHQSTPMRPMTSLPLAPSPLHLPNGAASSPHLVRRRHQGNGWVNWLPILHEDGRGLIQNSYRYHPPVWELCVGVGVGVGEATGGHANPWKHSERRCLTAWLEPWRQPQTRTVSALTLIKENPIDTICNM